MYGQIEKNCKKHYTIGSFLAKDDWVQAQKRKLIVGLLAHVDAGKTTLSEGMLFQSGEIRKLGRVDHRDAFLDTDIQERERGITIFSKQARLQWKDADITLLDTPGHVDFTSEMERALQVMDCAVLLISGADGVQGHTLTLWRLLKRYQVPVFLFVNKMDQPDTDKEKLLKQLQEELSPDCMDFAAEDLMDTLAMCSESMLSQFLSNGEISDGLIAAQVMQRNIFPCFFGSALKMEGVETLLDALVQYGPRKEYPRPFGARVYKIARDPQGARLTYMKITGGTLRVRDMLSNRRADMPEENVWVEKVGQIRLYSGAKYVTVDQAESGMVCAVTGLSFTRPGEGLGAENDGEAPMMEPAFTYQVLLPAGCDAHAALRNLKILEEEDPMLRVVWHERVQEIHLQLMGDVQLEIIGRVMRDRFHMPVSFSEGSILYRETIENTVQGSGHYEPLRHYAEVHLLLEPGKRGSGVIFDSTCHVDDLARPWQRLIMGHLSEKQHVGVLTGAPITDMKITLLAGRAHLKHTEGGDFRQATYRAVRHGLMQAKSVLLEPWYDMHLEVPQDCVGRAMNDVQQMGGDFEPPETHGDMATLKCSVPVEKARHYARQVTAYTRGRGRVSCTLRGYEPCAEQEKIVAAIGYDAERDTDNPADSVFCSHGAGVVIPWREAADHMHVQPQEEKARPFEPTAEAVVRKSSAYRGTLEEDKELMAVFEKTYGPVKNRTFFDTVRKDTPPAAAVQTAEHIKEYLLVDGYNVMFAWEDLKAAANQNLDHARQMLMDILCDYRAMQTADVILVFDAYKVQGSIGSVEKYNNIYVIYTKEAETADSYIEKATYEISRRHRVRVATSDGLEQRIILGNGALRVSAQEFRREVEAAQVEIARFLQENNRRSPSDKMEKAMMDAWKKKHQK
ncbi:MAG: TetM/TetW/TetO/TetS family tetracycline resistance ribosomal protection protein [Clostridia bacterium]|nr:TetM/TetW/TetO/TetS family tetracycline resistance ribosomal protection protein [Clostridia bacterium]